MSPPTVPAIVIDPADPVRSLVVSLARMPRLRPLAIRAVVLGVVDRLFEAAPPLMIGAGVDVATRGSDSFLGRLGFGSAVSRLTALGAASAAVWLLDTVSGYARGRAYADLADAVRLELRNYVYDRIQSLDVGVIEGRPASDWLSALRGDVDRVADFVESGIDPFVAIAANLLTVGTTLLASSPVLLAVQLLTGPAVYLISAQLLGPIRERERAVRKEESKLAAALAENVAGIATITSYGAGAAEARRVAVAGERVLEAAGRRTAVRAAYVPAIQLAVGAGFLTTLVYGGWRARTGRIAPGIYNVLCYSSLRLLASLGQLGTSLERFQRTMVSLERLAEVLRLEPAVQSGPQPLDPSAVAGEIRLDRVTFGYQPEKPVLRNLTLRLVPGRTTAVVGPSGAGKSTVLKLLMRFYDPQAGTAQLDGTDLRELRLEDLHRCVAVVPQEVFLFAGTVRENIAYGNPRAAEVDVLRAAEVAAARQFIEALPDGFETVIGPGGVQLSGGQRQRVAIARAVLADAPILAFDEATSAIDFETEAALQESLGVATAGRTKLVIAHRLSTIRRADWIYVLADGQLHEEGRHDDLARAGGLYASMWRVQTGEEPPGRAKPGSG
jgi:ATP-binding cassette subfamily B protein